MSRKLTHYGFHPLLSPDGMPIGGLLCRLVSKEIRIEAFARLETRLPLGLSGPADSLCLVAGVEGDEPACSIDLFGVPVGFAAKVDALDPLRFLSHER